MLSQWDARGGICVLTKCSFVAHLSVLHRSRRSGDPDSLAIAPRRVGPFRGVWSPTRTLSQRLAAPPLMSAVTRP